MSLLLLRYQGECLRELCGRPRFHVDGRAPVGVNSGSSLKWQWRPLIISSLFFKASVMCLRHSAGSMPPGGAIPIRRAVGFNGKVSVTVLTMGIPFANANNRLNVFSCIDTVYDRNDFFSAISDNANSRFCAKDIESALS